MKSGVRLRGENGIEPPNGGESGFGRACVVFDPEWFGVIRIRNKSGNEMDTSGSCGVALSRERSR
jgi:hypothetical protein